MIDDLKAQSREYYLTIGMFYHQFTEMEHQLACLIRNLITERRDTPRDYFIAVALLSGSRMGTLMDTVKRLLRILGVDKATKEAVDKIFAHLGDIQFLRNRLAHHFTRPFGPDKPDVWVNDDFASVKEAHKDRPLEFTLKTVRNAGNDLATMKEYLDPLFSDYISLPPGELKLTFDPSALPTWRYKPGGLSPHRPKSGDSQQWWSPPPQSSPR